MRKCKRRKLDYHGEQGRILIASWTVGAEPDSRTISMYLDITDLSESKTASRKWNFIMGSIRCLPIKEANPNSARGPQHRFLR